MFTAISEMDVAYSGQVNSENLIKMCESILQIRFVPVSSQQIAFALFFLNWFTVDKRHVFL